MPKRTDIGKILVIGSGPIIIGQAAEFDYSGTQACKTLREEGYEVVLINSNPATIMTDVNTADSIYIEPITIEFVARILKAERPQGILATLGGQTGLNMALALAKSGILETLGIELLGTDIHAIESAEDREQFKAVMKSIGEGVPESAIVHTLEEARDFAGQMGFPLIIRPAYTLGGTGGGIAENMAAFTDIVGRGLKASVIHQVLLEQSVAGWKEIEFEVIRDATDACVIVCTMENVDPVGIHTGDSIVVAPILTLAPAEIERLRQASFRIIRTLGIRGGCNIQFAYHPITREYVLIEVNPRVSRSSALASKATGYPIARVSTKISVGYTLAEIVNPVTGENYAASEPQPDYVVCKVPRWPFDKFVTANRTLGTQMKATGEVMSIGKNFEEALLKAIDSLDIRLNYHLGMLHMRNWSDAAIHASLQNADDERVFAISEALLRGMPVEEVVNITAIDPYFVRALKHIGDLGLGIRKFTVDTLPLALLAECKRYGFADAYIADLLGAVEQDVTKLRDSMALTPGYQAIQTRAGIGRDITPYYYSTYEARAAVPAPSYRRRVVVLGSGPIRIGQGIEFDYCSVHSVKTLKQAGVESIIINSNPETVSTDFDTSDKLYFEPLTKECVLDIVMTEKPEGVVVQFGGQTAINLAASLKAAGVTVLGTSVEDIDRAEDREKFLTLMGQLGIPTPKGGTATSLEEALTIAQRVGYPVLVRPSYVIGGRAMEILHNPDEMRAYIGAMVTVSSDHPVLVDQYLPGKEVEVDAVGDGKEILIVGVMEHLERAGVHSGDSIAVYPTRTVEPALKEKMIIHAHTIGKALKIRGLFNIQFVLYQGEVYVIEVNPRASRTVPILCKVTGLPMVDIATRIMLGATLEKLGYHGGLAPEPDFFTVKAPVFSFSKMTTVDIFLGPEMKSTGEVMGTDSTYAAALYKALAASGVLLPTPGDAILFSVCQRDRAEALVLAKSLVALNFRLMATEETQAYFATNGISATALTMDGAIEALKSDTISLVINTPTRGKDPGRSGFLLRRTAMEFGIPCVTSLDTAYAMAELMSQMPINTRILPLHSYESGPMKGEKP